MWDLTTVANDEVVFHLHSPDTLKGSDDDSWPGPGYEVISGLEPGTPVVRHGIEARTLERPPGELLCRFATVNDVHFGETECGKVGDLADAITHLSGAGMLRGVVGDRGQAAGVRRTARSHRRELVPGRGPAVPGDDEPGRRYRDLCVGPAAVVAKGDLTASGLVAEYDAFLQCYLGSFDERLLHVRGNHDAFTGRRFASEPWQELALPGVILAVLDTVIEGRDSGQLRDDQLEWLDELGSRADRAVLVFGHHHPWKPGSSSRAPTYFGINPDDSEQLVEVIARRPAITGYFAGHTTATGSAGSPPPVTSPTRRSPA